MILFIDSAHHRGRRAGRRRLDVANFKPMMARGTEPDGATTLTVPQVHQKDAAWSGASSGEVPEPTVATIMILRPARHLRGHHKVSIPRRDHRAPVVDRYITRVLPTRHRPARPGARGEAVAGGG